jgi:hypothetical protein
VVEDPLQDVVVLHQDEVTFPSCFTQTHYHTITLSHFHDIFVLSIFYIVLFMLLF